MPSNSLLNYVEIDDFEDVSHKRKSEVWLHFLSSKKSNATQCRYCGKIFKRDKKGSTTQLKKHLQVHHKEYCSADDVTFDPISVTASQLPMLPENS